jgi:hypothetical protein
MLHFILYAIVLINVAVCINAAAGCHPLSQAKTLKLFWFGRPAWLVVIVHMPRQTRRPEGGYCAILCLVAVLTCLTRIMGV